MSDSPTSSPSSLNNSENNAMILFFVIGSIILILNLIFCVKCKLGKYAGFCICAPCYLIGAIGLTLIILGILVASNTIQIPEKLSNAVQNYILH